jgi:hypothetical protein
VNISTPRFKYLQPYDEVIADETAELSQFAKALRDRVQIHRNAFQRPIDLMNSALQRACGPEEAEAALETCVARLRHLWLAVSSSSVNQSFRSPTVPKLIKTSTGQLISSGYERELQPVALESRCRAFFGPDPEGWTTDHVVLSSGQAAMTAALHLTQATECRSEYAQLPLSHIGSYFETTELLDLLPSSLKVIATGRDAIERGYTALPQVFLIEPIFFEDIFVKVDLKDLVRKAEREASKPKFVIFDDTLCGAPKHVQQDLNELSGFSLSAVVRVNSGLKLFQGGFELANVGILTVYAPVSAPLQARDFGDRLRKLRSLTGSGLAMVDAAALEAPWFLDSRHTAHFQAKVFINNARLARALAEGTRSFACISHPILDCEGGEAPFCVLQLSESSGHAYEDVEQAIHAESQRRSVLFEQGGSFGFRGHRYEVVRPGRKAPFLRVAIGSRAGCSLDGVIHLLRTI